MAGCQEAVSKEELRERHFQADQGGGEGAGDAEAASKVGWVWAAQWASCTFDGSEACPGEPRGHTEEHHDGHAQSQPRQVLNACLPHWGPLQFF